MRLSHAWLEDRQFDIDFGPSDGRLLTGLLAMGAALPFLISAIAGTLAVPRGDDWSYRLISADLARSGHLHLDGAATTMLVGQVLLVQPLLWLLGEGSGFAFAGLMFAAGGIVGVYILTRLYLRPAEAGLVTAVLALFPGYLAYATSFMTDVPAMAAQCVCLAFGALALRQRPVRDRSLIVALAAGYFAFSIRDFALAAPASVALGAVAADPRRMRHWLIGLIVLAICAGTYLWRSTLAGQVGELPPHLDTFARLPLAISTAALVLLPIAVFAINRWRRHLRWIDVATGAMLGVAVVVPRLQQWNSTGVIPDILLPNLTSQWGTPGFNIMIGGRPLLFPDPVWAAIGLLALFATIFVLAIASGIAGVYLRGIVARPRALVSRLGTPMGLLVIFVVLVLAGLAVYGLTWSVYDRYFWPVIPPLAILLLHVPQRLKNRTSTTTDSRHIPGILGATAAITTILSLISGLFLLNSHAFDAARWRAGEALATSGIPVGKIDAGYEWVGYHATSLATATNQVPAPIWYESWWPTFRLCGVASSEPVNGPGYQFVGTTKYSLYLLVGPEEPMYLYRATRPDCGVG